MSERIAILVIHGIGEQQPYETLDQFARNLYLSLDHTNPPEGKDTVGWTIEPLLDRPADPLKKTSLWTRVSYRLLPPAGAEIPFISDRTTTIKDITLFEYYWAPITQDKITYTGSLSFLINAGLKPFLYLASNLNALGDVEGRKRVIPIVIKEIWRQACLFTPLLLLFFLLLWWLQSVTLELFTTGLHVNGVFIASIVLLAIRYLYLYTSAHAFLATFKAPPKDWQRKPLWRIALIAGVLLHLLAWPFLLSPILQLIAFCGASLAHSLPILHTVGPWASFLRGLADATHFDHAKPWLWDGFNTFIFLNASLSIYKLRAFTLALVYLVRWILMDYVGDVAVYVNSNPFSNTFAARSQILDQCSTVLSDLLTLHDDPTDPKDPTTAKPTYDRVLIAAHSLGTVIAYDTMNSLLNVARTATKGEACRLCAGDLERLRGLITFGSPLNKIFYFFREQDDPQYALRRQSLNLLEGFRLKRSLTHPVPTPPFLDNPDPRWTAAQNALAKGFRWINAYALADPISGNIVFYDVDQQMRFKYQKPFVAHLEYWEDPDLYVFFREYLL